MYLDIDLKSHLMKTSRSFSDIGEVFQKLGVCVILGITETHLVTSYFYPNLISSPIQHDSWIQNNIYTSQCSNIG